MFVYKRNAIFNKLKSEKILLVNQKIG